LERALALVLDHLPQQEALVLVALVLDPLCPHQPQVALVLDPLAPQEWAALVLHLLLHLLAQHHHQLHCEWPPKWHLACQVLVAIAMASAISPSALARSFWH